MSKPGGKPADKSAMGAGLRAGLELVSALFVSVGIGLALDKWLGTLPLFMLGFFFLGIAAGFLNVWRLTRPRN